MRIIAGKFKSRRIFAPKIDIVRPTSDKMRETIFNILCHNNHLPLNLKNSSVLDLFSGSGAMSFEAISRGAKNATLIESNKDCISVINKNAEILGVNNIIKIIQLDATQLPINTINHNYCFIDPPYFKKDCKDSQYFDNYHFLEGFISESWDAIIDFSTKHLKLKTLQFQ